MKYDIYFFKVWSISQLSYGFMLPIYCNFMENKGMHIIQNFLSCDALKKVIQVWNNMRVSVDFHF